MIIFKILWNIIKFIFNIFKWFLGIGQPTTVYGIIKKVYDADTVLLVDNKKRGYYIRLANIDAPESKQQFGRESTQILHNKIINKQCYAKIKGTSHDRVVGTLYLGNTNINKWLVKNGLAWVVKKYDGSKPFIKLQKQAQRKNRGLWKHKNPQQPWKFRQLNK